jgi:hypothetical protein
LIPKWIHRLAWAILGIEEKDLEWFLGLDAMGQITIRTPHQLYATLKWSPSPRRRQDATRPLYFVPSGSGYRRGDTPSTLIYIAVFDILLTLLEDSDKGKAHAYADDLAHLARTLRAQQRQADLVCGFAAYTGIEI